MTRRSFLKVAASAAALSPAIDLSAAPSRPIPSKLPVWRGFNLLEKFAKRPNGNPPFRRSDLQWMEEWRFDFARIPMSYLCWGDPKDLRKINEKEIADIDQIIDWGKQHGVHINLNFHRAPGYCVNPPAEPINLWEDAEALEICSHHWAYFARRYKGISNDRLSFDLLNEPANVSEEKYVHVVRGLVAAIRKEHPERLIIADGLGYGREPVMSLADLGIGQSTRGYDPFKLSHWKVGWVKGSDQWPTPEWPLKDGPKTWDKDAMRADRIVPWKELEKRGVGVHAGEWGVLNLTPHQVALAWMKDMLALWREAGWGWALWNLRGPFGIVDSERQDVQYEDFRGHKLDRKMLDLLQAG